MRWYLLHDSIDPCYDNPPKKEAHSIVVNLDMFPGIPMDQRGAEDDMHSSHCCLVAIGRLQVTSTANSADLNGSSNQAEFISRHSIDGKFSFVDQRVMHILGYTPTELLGKSCYEFFHPEDQSHMKENFEQVLKQKGQMFSVMYRFRSKARDWIWLRTQAYAFLNPYTDDVEYIVCTNSSAKTMHNNTTAASTLDPVLGQQVGVVDPSVEQQQQQQVHHHQQQQQQVQAQQQQQQQLYQQPGLDYTQRAAAYGGHNSGMIPPPPAAHMAQGIQRPGSAQNAIPYGAGGGYEPNQSPIG